MIYLRWNLLPESDVANFRIFKSVVGVRLPLLTPASLAAKALLLKVDGGATQTINFDGVTPLVDRLNAVLVGAAAFTSRASPQHFYIRSNNRSTGSIQILPSSGQVALGTTPRLISEKSESFLIGTVAALPGAENFEFPDPDGTPHDWYSLTTVDRLTYESDKAAFKQAIAFTGNVCVLEGIVVDLRGARLADAEVKATLILYPPSSIQSTQVSTEPVTTLSGPDGRYSLILLQGTTVQLEINSVGFNRNIDVPEKPYAFVSDLMADLDYRFPLESF